MAKRGGFSGGFGGGFTFRNTKSSSTNKSPPKKRKPAGSVSDETIEFDSDSNTRKGPPTKKSKHYSSPEADQSSSPSKLALGDSSKNLSRRANYDTPGSMHVSFSAESQFAPVASPSKPFMAAPESQAEIQARPAGSSRKPRPVRQQKDLFDLLIEAEDAQVRAEAEDEEMRAESEMRGELETEPSTSQAKETNEDDESDVDSDMYASKPWEAEEQRWEFIKSILYTRPLTREATRMVEAMGGFKLEEHALLDDLVRKDRNFLKLLYNITNRRADSEQLKHFMELLEQQFEDLEKKMNLSEQEKREVYWGTGSGAEWARAALDDEEPLHYHCHVNKDQIEPWECARHIWGATMNLAMVGDNTRREVERHAWGLTQHIANVEQENERLKEEILHLKGVPGPFKPKSKDYIYWRRMELSEQVYKMIGDPEGWNHRPLPPAEAAHPWTYRRKNPLSNPHPKVLFVLWEGSLGKDAFYAPGVKKYTHDNWDKYVDPTAKLLTEEERRKALYMHCNHRLRHASVFISATSDLSYVSSVWQYRLKAKHLVDHVVPVLYLSVICTTSRMLDSMPILKFRDELAYYDVHHPEMDTTLNGVPAFEHEYLLPYMMKHTHVVGTWNLESVMRGQLHWAMIEEIRQKGSGAHKAKPRYLGAKMTDAKERDELALARWYVKVVDKKVDEFRANSFKPEMQLLPEPARDWERTNAMYQTPREW